MRSFLYTHLKIRNDDDWDRIKIQALTNPRKSRQAERGERERERINQKEAAEKEGGDEWIGQQGPWPHLQQWHKKRFVFPRPPQTRERERAKENKTKHTNHK